MHELRLCMHLHVCGFACCWMPQQLRPSQHSPARPPRPPRCLPINQPMPVAGRGAGPQQRFGAWRAHPLPQRGRPVWRCVLLHGRRADGGKGLGRAACQARPSRCTPALPESVLVRPGCRWHVAAWPLAPEPASAPVDAHTPAGGATKPSPGRRWPAWMWCGCWPSTEPTTNPLQTASKCAPAACVPAAASSHAAILGRSQPLSGRATAAQPSCVPCPIDLLLRNRLPSRFPPRPPAPPPPGDRTRPGQCLRTCCCTPRAACGMSFRAAVDRPCSARCLPQRAPASCNSWTALRPPPARPLPAAALPTAAAPARPLPPCAPT